MSAQAGIWNFDGKPADMDFLDEMSRSIAQHAPDGENTHLDGSIGMLYRPVHTTRESRFERQPHISARGYVITWDGRLDNREELIPQLPGNSMLPQTDVAIVSAAFERWGTDCFHKLIGDWAISVWDPVKRTLILAKDYAGLRHLYYYLTQKRVIWCKYLSPIVLLSRASFTLNDEYIAGYLASYAKTSLTPYCEILAVPPGSLVTIEKCKATVHRYWLFQPKRRIQYKSDAEYEEHFRQVLRQAVRRRLRSDSPILGELSGGIDSSSIICMADDIIAKGEVETPGLDTFSLYDPKEPGGDERHYSAIVEEKRGKKGHHLDMGTYGDFISLNFQDFIVLPGSSGRTEGVKAALSKIIQTHGYRVVLSGLGGDEFLGGVPNPCPQLADFIAVPRPIELIRHLAKWSLIKKRPWIQLFFQALGLFFPTSLRVRFAEQAKVAPWMDAGFSRRYRLAVRQMGPQGRYGFWQPSRRDYAQTFAATRRQLAYFPCHALGFEERRYPYLDQTLIEFLLSIPASQLLRPGQRRSLMRRALGSIVPPEILWRKTKGSVARSPLTAFQNTWAELESLFNSPLSARRGYINRLRFEHSLQAAKNGDAPQLIPLLKAVYLELWLRSLAERRIIPFAAETSVTMDRSLARQEV